jgi:hypothetical protein
MRIILQRQQPQNMRVPNYPLLRTQTARLATLHQGSRPRGTRPTLLSNMSHGILLPHRSLHIPHTSVTRPTLRPIHMRPATTRTGHPKGTLRNTVSHRSSPPHLQTSGRKDQYPNNQGKLWLIPQSS